MTDTPTGEKILSAFSDICLTFIKLSGASLRVLTPLTDLQQEILKKLGLDCAIYHCTGHFLNTLEINI